MFKRLGGFALSTGMFPVKLVMYPMLAVVAAVHGIGVGAWAVLVQLPLLVLSNLGPILMSPFKAGAAVAIWGGRNIGSILAFPIAPWSVVRRHSNIAERNRNDGEAQTNVALSFITAAICSLYGPALSLLAIDETNLFLHQHRYIVWALSATLALSGIYELGRFYYNYLTGKKANRPNEVPEAKIIAPRGYLTMLDKIQGRDQWSEEEAWTLVREAADVRSTDKDMKLDDMRQLVKMIVDRAPSKAVVR